MTINHLNCDWQTELPVAGPTKKNQILLVEDAAGHQSVSVSIINSGVLSWNAGQFGRVVPVKYAIVELTGVTASNG